MSESERKPSPLPYTMWLLDEPSEVFPSKAEWEEHLAKIKALVVSHGLTPQLACAIARAEAVIKQASV